ncbi:hypothetical protein [Desulfogranum marinum]|uniref:hypothetical protein n=1 Tax=Desulfogranum marinum TaxID=453220 RepID=UPI001966C910|nr:hypothetical protein [Desulfogranum marinum]MBM9511810.1 hypothetical protein [Desulfogranum marinum]
MHIYLWRHSNQFSSWSMIDEPQIYNDRYTSAEVAVIATSKEEAYQLLAQDGLWNMDDLQRIEPEIIPLDAPRILTSHIVF